MSGNEDIQTGSHGADWRADATTLAEDLAPAPNAPGHKKGSTVRLAYPLAIEKTVWTSSSTVPAAIMLSLSLKMLESEKPIRKELGLDARSFKLHKGRPPNLGITEESLLFDLYEARMASVVFGYCAVEAFANMWIEDAETYKVPGKDGAELQTGDKVLRYLSLSDKLTHVLPGVLRAKPMTKSGTKWREFVELRKLRDSIIHMKKSLLDRERSTAHNQGGFELREAKKNTFSSLIAKNSVEPPYVARRIMLHFARGERIKEDYAGGLPSWLEDWPG